MTDKKITIDIGTDGSVTVEAHNYNGVGCKAATEAIERALADKEGDRTFKPEYDSTRKTTTQQRLGGAS